MLLGAAPDRLQLRLYRFDHRLLALQAADPGGGAAFLHPLAGAVVGIHLVELPHRALFRRARIAAAHPRRIRGHAADLGVHVVRLLAQADEVAVGLGHFLTVQAGHLRRRREQRLGLRQDHLATAFQVAVQPLFVAERDVLLVLNQRSGRFQSGLVALLLVFAAVIGVDARLLLAHLLDRRGHRLLEAGLAAVEVVEAPRHFPGQLHMGHLVGAHRHLAGPVDQDVRRLQQRVAEKAVGAQVFLAQFFLLVLVGRYPFQPGQRRHHRQQQMQLGVLGHLALDEQRGGPGVHPGGQPVDHQVPDVALNTVRILVFSGQTVPVRDEKETLVLMLQARPILKHAMVMPQMQAPGGAHARYHSLGGNHGTQKPTPVVTAESGDYKGKRRCKDRAGRNPLRR